MIHSIQILKIKTKIPVVDTDGELNYTRLTIVD